MFYLLGLESARGHHARLGTTGAGGSKETPGLGQQHRHVAGVCSR